MTIKKVDYQGKPAWRVYATLNTGPHRKFFTIDPDNPEEAHNKAKEYARNLESRKAQIAGSILSLPQGEQALVLEAYKKATDAGINLYEAVSFYLLNNQGSADKIEPLVVEYLNDRKFGLNGSRQLRPDSYGNVERECNKFKDLHGEKEVREISVSLVRDFIFREENSGAAINTLKCARTDISGFFKWLVNRELMVSNPCSKIQMDGGKRKKITYLNAAQVKKLLQSCLKIDPRFAVNQAIQFFAGLRVGEITGQQDCAGLSWEDVKTDKGSLEVIESKDSRVADGELDTVTRSVPIHPTLMAWLELGGDLFPTFNERGKGYDYRITKIKLAADLGSLGQWDWGRSIARHTFATMHVGAYQEPESTRYMMGHEDGSKVFKKHYDGRVDKAEAEKFWELTPDKVKKLK
tara:strand:+ start:2636 stop:3856 length:1221 start_codon:yes stop_codon:yes gene_type:complete